MALGGPETGVLLFSPVSDPGMKVEGALSLSGPRYRVVFSENTIDMV